MRRNLWSLRRSYTWNLTCNYSYRRLDHFDGKHFVLWCMRTSLAKFLVILLFYYSSRHYYIFTGFILFWNLTVLLATAITCSRRLHNLIAVGWKGFSVTRLIFQPFIFIQFPCVLLSWKKVLSKTPYNITELFIAFAFIVSYFCLSLLDKNCPSFSIFFFLQSLCFSLHNLFV